MKHLRKFNENAESSFDIDLAMTRIKEEFSADEVAEKYDNEMLEWIDEDWEEDYDSEYDWYIDHNNGEAQDVVVSEIINWYKSEFNKELSIEEYSDLHDAIKEEYDLN